MQRGSSVPYVLVCVVSALLLRNSITYRRPRAIPYPCENVWWELPPLIRHFRRGIHVTVLGNKVSYLNPPCASSWKLRSNHRPRETGKTRGFDMDASWMFYQGSYRGYQQPVPVLVSLTSYHVGYTWVRSIINKSNPKLSDARGKTC